MPSDFQEVLWLLFKLHDIFYPYSLPSKAIGKYDYLLTRPYAAQPGSVLRARAVRS